MTGAGNYEPEAPDKRRGRKGAPPLPAGVSRDQMAALVNAHSGLPRVVVQEWAILLRCKGARPVAVDELVESLIQWFEAPLSAPEIMAFLERLIEQGWLARIERGQAFHTTALGEEVLAQTERPLLQGAVWSLRSDNMNGDER